MAITIVIILILAGISIVTLTGNNGLLSRAKQAKKNTLDAQNVENLTLGSYNSSIDKAVNGTRNTNGWNTIYNGNVNEVLNLDISQYNDFRLALMYNESQCTGWQEYSKTLLSNRKAIQIMRTFADSSGITSIAMILYLYENQKLSYYNESVYKGAWTVSTYTIIIQAK